jgi:acyl-CoA synthetase (NDP forming)
MAADQQMTRERAASDISGVAKTRVPAELFQPKSVVIVGASSDRTKLSNKPLLNLLGVGYGGRVYVVNPGAREIEGVASYPDIAALPETPDLAFLVVPGQHALDAATGCAERGVKAAIVASTGFAEAGGEGVARQTALTELARRHGIRFVGPNTNGLYSAHDRLSLGYNSAHEETFEPGAVSVVSHSGALFNVIAERMRGERVGLSKFIAVGNEADLDMLDFFDHLVTDETTKVILLIVEAVRDGARFRAIAERAHAAGKRIAALKLGTSNAGAASTAAHSSRLAGSRRAYAAFFKSAGIGVVSSVEALVAFARLAAAAPPGWRGSTRQLGLMTASGAAGTILADSAARHGFGVAALAPQTIQRLSQFNAEGSLFNPLDVASFGGSRSARQTAPLLSGDPAVEAVVAYAHKLQTPHQREAFTFGMVDGLKQSGKLHVVLAPGGLPEEQRALFESHAVPVFFDSAAAIEGLAALYDSGATATSSDHVTAPEAVTDTAAVELNEHESMAILDGAGISTVPRLLAESADEAISFADHVGWPVVLKGVVDGIAHKSDVGLVRLDIDTPAKLRDRYDELRGTIARLTAGADGCASICVQKMLGAGFEIIAGVTHEPPLGRFLVVGLGGRNAEQIDDVHLWAIPAPEQSIRTELAATAVGRVLSGPRWARKESFDEVVDVLIRLQREALRIGPRLKAIEINPLWTGDGKSVALDALVVMSGPRPGVAKQGSMPLAASVGSRS